MAKKDKKDNKEALEIEQALDNYLKNPTEDTSGSVLEKNYAFALKKRLRKAGGKLLRPALDLMLGDKSEQAALLLKESAQSPSLPLWFKIEALDGLKTRGADYDESLYAGLVEIDRAAKDDDGEAAGKLYAELGESLRETFAEAMVEHGAVKALEGALSAGVDKAGMKILRRAAHALSSKGHKIAEIGEKGEAIFKPPEKEEPSAFATHYDTAGKRVIYMTQPAPMGAINIFQAVIDEKTGLEDFQGVESNRRGLHMFLKRATGEGGGIPVDPVYASYLLDKAASSAKEKSKPLPPDYIGYRSMLPHIPSGYEPEDPLEKLPEKPSAADAKRAGELLERDDFFGWTPDFDALQALQLRLDEIKNSQVIINEAQRKEQVRNAFVSAAEKYLDGEAAGLLASRLVSSAYLFMVEDKVEAAKISLAAAAEIKAYISADRGAEAAASPPELVVAMFMRAFPDALKDDDDQEKPDDGKSGSGIIIP